MGDWWVSWKILDKLQINININIKKSCKEWKVWWFYEDLCNIILVK